MDLVKARLSWVELYARTGTPDWSAAAAGISRPTLRKWWRRFQSERRGQPHRRKSRRPHPAFAAQKVFADQEAIILAMRRERRLGVKQLRNELIRQHQIVLSLDTLHRVLLRHNELGPQAVRRAGARVSGVTAGRSRGTASRWTSARSGLESINARPSTIAAAIRFCVFTTGLQRRAHSTFQQQARFDLKSNDPSSHEWGPVQ